MSLADLPEAADSAASGHGKLVQEDGHFRPHLKHCWTCRTRPLARNKLHEMTKQCSKDLLQGSITCTDGASAMGIMVKGSAFRVESPSGAKKMGIRL